MRNIRAAVAVAVVASGCGSIFDLEPVELPGGGSGSGACALPGRTQDEDSDDRTDGCDPCPADPMLDGTDLDMDGVGDVCDPDTAVPSKIVEFDGFAPGLAWQPQQGTWAFMNGDYEPVTGVGGVASELTVPLTEYPRVDAIFDGMGFVGVKMDVGASSVSVECTLELRAGNPDQLALRIGALALDAVDLDAGAGAGRLRLGIAGDGSFYCIGERNGIGNMATAAAPTAGATTARIGVIGTTTQVFHSVTVFGNR